MHAEFQLRLGIRHGRKCVARLMRVDCVTEACHRHKRGHTPAPATHADLVRRKFHVDGPDRLWFTDITQHRAADEWVYCCADMDAWSRQIVVWAIADHIRTEPVVDALGMACWQRRPAADVVLHADRSS